MSKNLLISTIALGALSLCAETTFPQRGFLRTGSYSISEIDAVDNVSASLKLNVPLAQLPKGRGGTSFGINLVYDSQIYNAQTEQGVPEITDYLGTIPLRRYVIGGGWRYNFANIGLDPESRYPVSGDCSLIEAQRPFRLSIVLPDGSRHLLHPIVGTDPIQHDGYYARNQFGNPPGCPSQTRQDGPMRYFTSDSSFIQVVIDNQRTGNTLTSSTWTAYLPNGSRVTGRNWPLKSNPVESNATYIHDRNGNSIKIENVLEAQGNGPDLLATMISENFTGGRSIKVRYNSDLRADFSTQDVVEADSFSGAKVNWVVNWSAIQIGGEGPGLSQYNYPCGVSDPTATCRLSLTPRMLKSIQLPSTPLTDYQFGYSDNANGGFGELDYAKTPTGAVAEYRYALEGLFRNSFDGNFVKTRKITADGVPALWTYTQSYNSTTGLTSTVSVGPDGAQTEYRYFTGNASSWFRGLVMKIVQPDGTQIDQNWGQNRPYGLTPLGFDPQNPYVQSQVTTLPGGGVSTTTFAYDKNGNLKSKTETPFSNETDPTLLPASRVTQSIYYGDGGDATAAAGPAEGANFYWGPIATYGSCGLTPSTACPPRPLSVPTAQRVTGGNQANVGLAIVHQGAISVAVSPQATSWVYSDYDSPTTTANLTSRRVWDSQRAPSFVAPLNAGNSIEKTYSYDGFGNPTGQGGASVASSLVMDGDGFYPVTITSGSGGSNPDGKNLRLDWHRPTGLLKSIEDVSKQTLTTMTYDALGRPKQVIEGLKSGASLRLTEYSYDDLARIVVERRDLRVFGDGLLKTVTHYDQLGRPRLVRTVDGEPFSETSEASGIKQENRYRWIAAGREELTSNPYRTASDPTAGWTCTRYDKLGRVTITARFAGSALPAACDAAGALEKVTTVYGGLTSTVTDGEGRSTVNTIDRFGRLVKVVQGGQSTTYAYDHAGNLRKVNQGIQSREFEYSSAGLLTWTKTPERQEERHQYDAKGRLQSRNDANNTTVTTSYDALDRPISIGSGGSLISNSYYGGTGCKQGELSTVSYNGHFYNYDDYDCLGRIVQATQTTSGDAGRIMRHTYLLNDEVATFQYPGGRLVTYTYDDAGRPTNLASGGVDYVTTSGLPTGDKAYTAHGALAKRKLGSGVWENLQFDGALRLKALDVGTAPGTRSVFGLDYTFEQNGNVKSQSIVDFTPSATRSQIYGYDAVNRLTTMTEDGSAISQSFNYDPYGNLAATGTGTTDMPTGLATDQYNQLTNRFKTPGNYDYNADGSLKRNRSWGYEYDWAGQLIGVTQDMSPDPAGIVERARYEYDGTGRRVKRVINGSTTFYVYNADGELVAEYGSSTATDRQYLTQDHLGSTRLITRVGSNIAARRDYYPFGASMTTENNRSALWGAAAPAQQFTSKERDVETGLDYFGARYMAAAQGRFTSPDLPLYDQHPSGPQSWNLYSYVRNNPLIYTDPDGRGCDAGNVDNPAVPGPTCKEIEEENKTLKPSVTVVGKRDDDVMEMYEFWKQGTLPSRINYDANDPMTVNMRDSAVVRARMRDYAGAGCPEVFPAHGGHFEGFFTWVENRLIGPWNPTQFQVGGFSGSIKRNGSVTVTYTIRNGMTQSSFDGTNTLSDTLGIGKRGSSDNPHGKGGPRHNVLQVFSWTEYNPCSR